jgi:hypothetical protein
MSSLAVRFSPDVLAELRARADTEGVLVTQLIRSWTLERLQMERMATLPPDVADALQVIIRHLTTPAPAKTRGRL